MPGPWDHLIGGALQDPEDPAFPLIRYESPPVAGVRRFMHTLGGQQYQADAGSCTAHGFSAPMEAIAAVKGADFQVCRQDLYFGARWVENNGAETRDGGAYPNRVREWANGYGLLPESVKAYRAADVTTWKPLASLGARRRLLRPVLTPIERTSTAIKAELLRTGPVSICHAVYGQMVNGMTSDGIEKGVVGGSLGGHCRAVVGFNDDFVTATLGIGAVLVQNSWKGWGIAHPDQAVDARFLPYLDSFSWVPYSVLDDPRWLQDASRVDAMPEVAP